MRITGPKSDSKFQISREVLAPHPTGWPKRFVPYFLDERQGPLPVRRPVPLQKVAGDANVYDPVVWNRRLP